MRSDWLAAAVAADAGLVAVPLALRVVVAATAAGAIVATTTPTWNAPDGYVVPAVLAAVASVAVPDSGSGLVFVVAIVVTWLTGGPGGVGPAVVVTALALLAGHVAGALAAAMPVTARAEVDGPCAGHGRRRRSASPSSPPPRCGRARRPLAGSRRSSRCRPRALTAAAWRWSAPTERRVAVGFPAVLAILDISTGYQIFGMLHVLAAIVAFGPLFIYPSLQRAGAGATLAKLHLRIVLPALTLLWVLGMGMVGMSDEMWKIGDSWIVLSLLGWVVAMVVSWFLIRPALTDTSASARSRMSAGIGITHLVLIVVLYLMIFKPGESDRAAVVSRARSGRRRRVRTSPPVSASPPSPAAARRA